MSVHEHVLRYLATMASSHKWLQEQLPEWKCTASESNVWRAERHGEFVYGRSPTELVEEVKGVSL